MYKPFVTCDDPKGVVECGTIRRYRTNSRKMKDKTSSRRTAESLETNKPDKEEKVSKGSTERSFDPSSLQLVEVSRGAEKLNNMIESWSRGMRYDGRSGDIAKDLLKGALDLQESLEVLRKVQEASHNMPRSNSKRKQDEKPERSRIDTKLMDRTTHSNQLGEQRYPMGFQRGYPSADCSSSSCREELKKVIKESLVRQNLLPSTSSEGLDSASASAFPSTNSSQSSVVWNDKLSDSSFSPTFSRKERGSNLIAKLMGLEEVPSRSFPPVMQKQLETQKILNQKRPVFEIDKPNARKNSSKFEKVNPEKQQTLREILETTHFNGLLKSPIREQKLHVHHSNDLHYKQLNDLPPIVLMKPRCTPYQEFVKTYEPVPPEDLSFRNLKAKTVSSKTFKPREGSTTNMENEMKDVFKRFTKEERTMPFKEVGKEMEEHVSKRFTKEGRTKHFKEVVELDVKEIKPVENEKAHASHKFQGSETVDRKAKVKPVTTSRKLPEKEVSKSRVVTKTRDQGEISSTSAKLRKPQSGSRINRSEIPSRKNIISNTLSKPKNTKINNSKEQRKSPMKKQVSVAEPEAAKPIDEEFGREEGRSIDVPCKDDCAEIKIITTITDNLTMEHEAEACENKTIEHCEQGQNSSCDDVMMIKYEYENDAISTEEAHETTSITDIDTMPEKDSADTTGISEFDFKTDKDSAELKYLLLTSQSFIDHAEELLNLDVDYPKILPKVETSGISNIRLYLDCANEITDHKSHRESQVVHPLLLTCAGNSRMHISLGKLVEEVYNAIGILTSYSENSEKKLMLDNIFAMMERDMKYNNGLINGIWNWGWRHGFSSDEAEQVVNDVENLVLGGLIEEVIVNL